MAIFVKQGYLVVIGKLLDYWFTLLPELTTWVLLVAMPLYDLAAVLLPGEPLRLLVELAISRHADIPALVNEARPNTNHDLVPSNGVIQRKVWRETRHGDSDMNNYLHANSDLSRNVDSSLVENSDLGTLLPVERDQSERDLVDAEEGQIARASSELSAPLIQHRINVWLNSQEVPAQNFALERISLGSSGAVKLGFADFIFWSVLVGRAAMYDFMRVYACYLAIIASLGITLMLLAFYQKALPVLPVSILLDVLFYLLTRLLLETYIVQCSINLLMF